LTESAPADLDAASALALRHAAPLSPHAKQVQLAHAPPAAPPAGRFHGESYEKAPAKPALARRFSTRAVLGAILVGLAALGFFAGTRYASGRLSLATTAAVHVDSAPQGARVLVDGTERGRTPVDFVVAPGRRRLEVAAGDVQRTLEFTASAGGSASHYFDLTSAAGGAAAAEGTGTLVVRSEPAGATVVVDGRQIGTAPVTVARLEPGTHDVRVLGPAGAVGQRVQVQAGLTATLVVPMGGRAAASGWLTVRAPVELTILEGGQVVNTTRSEQIMLTAGRHDLEFVNEEFEVRLARTVVIPAGRRFTLDLPMPSGRANINARPWAEVWVGDQRLGETPLGNVLLPVGRHEVVFRHPQLGERRQPLVVKANTPARVVADLVQ
jgi:hypothetical protein